MKIFVSHSTGFDFKNKIYKPLKGSQIYKYHNIFLPHDQKKDVLTKGIIKKSDLVLAEVSCPSTGQGIELGWAEAYKVPIVIAYKKGSKISGSLKYLSNNFISYTSVQELIKQFTDFIRNSN